MPLIVGGAVFTGAGGIVTVAVGVLVAGALLPPALEATTVAVIVDPTSPATKT